MYEDYQTKPRALWIAALVFCVVVIADSWFRWATFQYGTFDVAFYTQALWLALHGHAHVSLLDVPLMGNHAEPICYLLLPFFWIWKSPMLFIVAQALMLATMPFTAWRIARRMEFARSGARWMALPPARAELEKQQKATAGKQTSANGGIGSTPGGDANNWRALGVEARLSHALIKGIVEFIEVDCSRYCHGQFVVLSIKYKLIIENLFISTEQHRELSPGGTLAIRRRTDSLSLT